MNLRLILLLVLLSPLSATAETLTLSNALVVRMDNDGSVSESIFKGNSMYVIEDGRVAMQMQSGGNCAMYVYDQGVKIVEKCSELGNKIDAMVNRMKSQMGVSDEQMAMLRQFNGSNRPQEPMKALGTRQIAGVTAECHSNSSREFCYSTELEQRIKREGFNARQLASEFAKINDRLGMAGNDNDPVDPLRMKGFPVLDMKTASSGNPGIPGWEMIPQAQRDQILAQMGRSGGGGAPSGSKLHSVNRESVNLSLPQLRQVGLEEFYSEMMQKAMSGMPR